MSKSRRSTKRDPQNGGSGIGLSWSKTPPTVAPESQFAVSGNAVSNSLLFDATPTAVISLARSAFALTFASTAARLARRASISELIAGSVPVAIASHTESPSNASRP